MKPVRLSPLLALSRFATAFRPFVVSDLTTHQPNGNPDGQVNYYNIGFNVSRTTSASASAPSAFGFCHVFWGDNTFENQQAYSVNVPAGEWIRCDNQTGFTDDESSPFQFKLFPYFSIGNFSLEIQQDATKDHPILYGWSHVTNTTGFYTCTIDPTEAEYLQHAQGDCSIAPGRGALRIAASSSQKSWWY